MVNLPFRLFFNFPLMAQLVSWIITNGKILEGLKVLLGLGGGMLERTPKFKEVNRILQESSFEIPVDGTLTNCDLSKNEPTKCFLGYFLLEASQVANAKFEKENAALLKAIKAEEKKKLEYEKSKQVTDKDKKVTDKSNKVESKLIKRAPVPLLGTSLLITACNTEGAKNVNLDVKADKKFKPDEYLKSRGVKSDVKVSCCNSCFFHSKILTLVDAYKGAVLDLKIQFESEILEFRAFGFKTDENGDFYQNLLCILINNVNYVIVEKDNTIKYIELKLKEAKDPFYYIEGAFKALDKQPDNLNINLVKIPHIFIKRGTEFARLQTEAASMLKAAFEKAYPRLSIYQHITKNLKKKKDIKVPVKKVPKKTYDFSEYLDYLEYLKMPQVITGIVLCVLGTLFLIIREISVSKPRKGVQRVPVL